MQIRGSLEDNILTVLCWSEKHAPALVMRLSVDIFSTRIYRTIAEAAYAHIERYSKPPKTHIRDLLEEKLRRGEEGKLLGRTLDAMEELAADIQAEYVLESLDRFIEKRRLASALERASDALQADDLAAAKEAMHAPGLGQDAPALEGVFIHDPERMLRFMEKREQDTFSSGIEVFDQRDVRPARKEQWILIAPAKKGKTWHLIEVGKVNMMRGHKVLHITLENSEEVTARRYVMSLFAMTKARAASIRTAMFSKDNLGHCTAIDFDVRTTEGLEEVGRAKLAEKLRNMKNRGKLLIKEFPTGSLTIAQYIAYLDWLEKAKGFVPDMVLLDYPNLMKINTADLRISLGAVFRELRGVAVARNHALVAVTQGNRTSADAKIVNDRMIAEDYSIIGTADTVVAYSQTGEEKRVGLARLLVSNARNAEDAFITLVSQNYATGQFSLDSVYMNRHLETEVNKFTGGGDKDGENAD